MQFLHCKTETNGVTMGFAHTLFSYRCDKTRHRIMSKIVINNTDMYKKSSKNRVNYTCKSLDKYRVLMYNISNINRTKHAVERGVIHEKGKIGSLWLW